MKKSRIWIGRLVREVAEMESTESKSWMHEAAIPYKPRGLRPSGQ